MVSKLPLNPTLNPTEISFPKFRQPSHLQTYVVNKIPCKDCSWNYIGETGRCRKKEHIKNIKDCTKDQKSPMIFGQTITDTYCN